MKTFKFYKWRKYLETLWVSTEQVGEKWVKKGAIFAEMSPIPQEINIYSMSYFKGNLSFDQGELLTTEPIRKFSLRHSIATSTGRSGSPILDENNCFCSAHGA